MITLTDAQQTFGDSPEGRHAVAKVRLSHETRERHKGANARPWTDAMEREAIRSGATAKARSDLTRAADERSQPAALADALAHRDQAYAERKERTRNAWRDGR